MNAAHAIRIARTELVRRFRVVTGMRAQLVALGVGLLFGVVPLFGSIVVAYFAGQGVAAGEFGDPVGVGRLLAAGLPTVLALLTALRAVQTTSVPVHPDGLLTTVPHREAVAGLLLTELTVTLGVLGAPLVGVPVAYGVGSGALLAIPLAFLALLSLIVLGVLSGFALGLVVRNAVARSETLARYKTAIAAVLFVVYFVAVTNAETGAALAPVVGAVGETPLGWFADLALYGTTPDAVAVRAAGAGVLTLVGVPALAGACSWLAAWLWYAQPVRPESDDAESSGIGTVAFLPRRMARIARKSWIRAKRGPIRLLYVLYPLFLLVAPIQDAVVEGRVPTALPPLLAFYGAWATGAAFTLNPIGDEGPVLPVTLTTPVGGRTFMGGLCLAGAVVGVPLTVLAAGVSGVLSDLGTPALAAVLVGSVVLPLSATALATGIGTLFPRMESVRVSRTHEAIVPSLIAFAVYSLVLVVTGIPVLVAGTPLLREGVVSSLGVGTTLVVAGGVALSVVLAGLAGGLSLRYAVGRFEDYYLG
ncbi:hypothetical protein [Halomarina litorea]|uniref:hypothetical protein n=1 Tax=Halomarina litorea TaxID=2961595 RepID=UPI0020C23506|nr:hypothetical protein [Halomarina sp. BCD28]